MSELLLGIDAGNTVVKAVLFDRRGQVQAKAARDGRSREPEPGFVERDIAELWRNAADVVKECLAQADAKGADVAAVGLSGHGNGLYLLDGENRPLLGIQSLDHRAADLAEELLSNGAAQKVYPLCLQKPWPAQTATLLAWVKHHRPEVYRAIGTAFLCKDALAFLLTGERSTDYSDMSGSGLMNIAARSYDDELLAAYGLQDAMAVLPRLVQSDRIAGRISAEAAGLTRLAAGTPVAAGFFDIIASALGAGASMPGQAAIVAGSWGINQIILDRPLADERIFHAATWRPDRYVAVESSATSAVNLEWFAREIMGGHDGQVFARCNELVAEVEAGPDLPLFHPFLYGSATAPDAKGAFLGLSGWHGKAHLLHALYEGVVFEHRRHIDRLRAAGARFEEATLSGGGARSAVWCQMFADGIGVPVTVAECEETGALGAAIAAGVAGGLFDSLEAGVTAMVRPKTRYEPRPETGGLGKARYSLYLDLAEMLPRRWKAYRSEIS